ncbi:stalk domain-containing protein [Paenibacillus brasilensis]|uniref:Copper amine oxidase-like N-terminal domain-containing protein n=1 Tax=Paenibacillus brasilensis TaxID=128574 RepID=A0ABU0L6L1_9BACL|nr:stalk domain-containing protein [Paenibacillus brasilensis]MDQ0496912.1 hypothetical protein [Paenibacillus brasilensis]
MKDKVKGLLLGVAIGTMFTGGSVLAANYKGLDVVFKDIQIYVDQVKKSSNSAIIYDGTTYIPARTVSKALDKQVSLDGNNLYIGKQPINKNITKAQAVKLVKEKYFPKAPSQLIIEVDNTEGNTYLIHAYEVVIDDPNTGAGHTATWGWYYVDMKSGKVTSMF